MPEPTPVEVIRKALAWVGYNAPNESDRLRAFDALAAADGAVEWFEAELAGAEAELTEARELILLLRREGAWVRGNGEGTIPLADAWLSRHSPAEEPPE